MLLEGNWMTRDFAIILDKNYSIKYLDKMIAETADIEVNYKISKKNHVIITRDVNIVWDIENKIVKGRVLDKNGEKERIIIENFISKLGRENIYIHFYGKDNFLSPDLKTI